MVLVISFSDLNPFLFHKISWHFVYFLQSSTFKTPELQWMPMRIKERLSISVFAGNIGNQSTRDLTEEKVTFLWLQLLTSILLHMPQLKEEAHKEMVNVCRWEYRDNSNGLNVIKEFTENYTSDQAIHWYTRDSFLYRLLNKALRSQNIDIIFKFRLIIADVYKQLNELFEAQYPVASIFQVWRGQLMTTAEVERLKDNLNRLISMNSFVSTSRNKNVACTFLSYDTLPPAETTYVLFEITIDSKVAREISVPFADIKSLSFYRNEEEEILLCIGSVFRVDNVVQTRENLWHIKITMCSSDEDAQVNR